MDKVMEKIARWKLLAEQFCNYNTKVFIRDLNGNYYFCYILLVGEDTLRVDAFGPAQRIGKHTIDWLNVEILDRYNEEVVR